MFCITDIKRALRLAIIGAGCFSMSSLSFGVEVADFTKAKNFYLGQALLDVAYGDPFHAVAVLQYANEEKQLSKNSLLALHYLAQMYIELGLSERAMETYQTIAKNGSGDESDQAWLVVAKLAIENGRYDLAQQSLPKKSSGLSKSQRIERDVADALVQLYRRNANAAVRALPKLGKDDSMWSLYQRYNIGATLLSHYRNKKGALTLGQLGKLEAKGDPDRKAIRDQANLALGYSLLQLKKASQSRKYFSKIGLDTAMANQALLGMGWAYSMDNKHEKALIYWLELQKSPVASSHLYESTLAVPYGYGHAGVLNKAAEAYDSAVNRFEADITAINAAKEDIARHAMIEMLETGGSAGEFDWVKTWQPKSEAGVGYFVPLLMESPAFQSLLREYRSTLRLRERVGQMRSAFAELEERSDAEVVRSDIESAYAKHDLLMQKFKQSLGEMESKLESLAIDILNTHQAQLEGYARQARFGLAQAIEQATFGAVEAGQ